MEENKKILLTGKLSGTRTFISDLEKIEFPDSIEQFLLMFSQLKLELPSTLKSNKVNYINNDQDFLQIIEKLQNSNYISIYHNQNFSRLYITIDTEETFMIRLNKVSPAIIGTFISKEIPIKFAINSFEFIKWCNSNCIDIKNLLDIPTYIKLLTNDVDPFKNAESYFTQYTNYTLEPSETNYDNNSIAISHFIYTFGKFLAAAIEEFDLTVVNRLINENSYYEGNSFNNTGNCSITFSYNNVQNAISSILPAVLEKYKNKAYIISPLNRIAPVFKQNLHKLIYELYEEDLTIAILNELYNNNIPVKFNYTTNEYIITCKFKNFSNIISVLQAIFYDVFFTLFDQSPEIHIDCIVKE